MFSIILSAKRSRSPSRETNFIMLKDSTFQFRQTQWPNLRVNQLVLLKDSNTKPLDWPMGRILEVFPGNDDLVRVVKLKPHREGTTDQRGRSHPLQCNTLREGSVCAYHSASFTAELSVRKTSIAWSTLDAEPQMSPPPMGGIGYYSRTPLVCIASTLNSQHYIPEVLEPVVLPYLQGLAPAIFLHDNARPHVAHIVQRFFVNHQIELLPWPARSPDLSPIENMWSMVAQRLTQITPPAAPPDQL
ncbi:hypothetical protein TNCV_2435711 [Trichonephila clavipes]|nr:hypothetical protein TNCV_2435711 [Trichonephila clavipes]